MLTYYQDYCLLGTSQGESDRCDCSHKVVFLVGTKVLGLVASSLRLPYVSFTIGLSFSWNRRGRKGCPPNVDICCALFCVLIDVLSGLIHVHMVVLAMKGIC